MKTGIKLRWKIYAFIYAPSALFNFVSLLHPESSAYIFYHTLAAFYKPLYLFYVLNVLSSICALLSVGALVLFITKKEFLPRVFWKWVLALRVIFDLSDHLYEWSVIKSLFYFKISIGLATAFLMIIIVLPSYLAFYKFISRPRDLFSK